MTSAQRSRNGFYILIGVLLLIGTSLLIHRHWVFQVPLTPGDSHTLWSIEARMEFSANGDPVRVLMARPNTQKGYVLLNETGASPGYGLNFYDEGHHRHAEWTVRTAQGRQQLYYRAEFLQNSKQSDLTIPAPELKTVQWAEPAATAIADLLNRAQATSADNYSLTRELLKLFNSTAPLQHVQMLQLQFYQQFPELLADMLHKARVPATVVYALHLQDGRRRQALIPVLRVWQDDSSRLFALPSTDFSQVSDDLHSLDMLLWEQQGTPILEVSGASASTIRFAMIRRQEGAYGSIAESLSNQYDLLNFSIHGLPLEEQALFQTILLLPIGALIVCILRILIGIRTSGTFMPVLIALAFVQTSLVTGVIGFLLVVSTGLLIRSYLSHLNLLLVARITAVIISVIAIISVFSVLAYKVGLSEGLKITFFPMIILAWTIERMSILWEEEGGREVMIQGGGSLITAILAYWAMSDPLIRHLTFNFIGVQFIVMALVLLLGSYTGYRLSELRRFSVFRSSR